MKIHFLGLLFLVAACAVSPDSQRPEVLSSRITAATQNKLCSAYRDPRTTSRGTLMIEAELAVRGVKQCGGVNYGHSSVAALGLRLYSRQGSSPHLSSADLQNCSDFPSGAAAQKFFLAAGGPISDPNNLDRDGDGLACEWGAQIKRIATYRAPVVPRRWSSGSICHTGSRGGRYTITASGNKDYNGC